ncbi:MAG: hypothetical protein WA400_10090, partial [Silvibacterium sp.]
DQDREGEWQEGSARVCHGGILLNDLRETSADLLGDRGSALSTAPDSRGWRSRRAGIGRATEMEAGDAVRITAGAIQHPVNLSVE